MQAGLHICGGPLFYFASLIAGGEGGIRTHGDREATTLFESAPFVHSGTSPVIGLRRLYHRRLCQDFSIIRRLGALRRSDTFVCNARRS